MRVLNVSHGADPAGWGYLAEKAFHTTAPDIEYQSVADHGNYIEYPTRTITWKNERGQARLRRLWNKADVIHLCQGFELLSRVPGIQPKPLVIQYHGTRYRRRPNVFLRQQCDLGAVGIVSTLDLQLIAPDQTEWIGAPYDGEWLRSFRRPHDTHILRIGHAPTSREIKSTEAFLAACDHLAREHPVEVVLIERKTWTECLALKGTVDIFYDQCQLGYGSNAIEAWGMGIPVIAGAAEETLAEYQRRFGSLPFVRATEDTIYDALSTLTNPTVREHWSQRGIAHFDTHHSQYAVVPQLEQVYRRAIAHAGRRLRVPARGKRRTPL